MDKNMLILKKDGTLVSLTNDKCISDNGYTLTEGQITFNGIRHCNIVKGSSTVEEKDGALIYTFKSDTGKEYKIRETKEFLFNLQEIINENIEL